jgi:UDP-4-amino-4,6-dideoxy-N-acetyl-beta-L-altrosamine transaminase
MIPYARQHISAEDVAAVIKVLRSDWLTQGPAIPDFEKRVADRCGVSHAVAVNSATSGLHIACLALGLGPSDWLWTVPNTFVASANCGAHCGAHIDFVDIDPGTLNISIDALERKLVQAKREGRLPKIVVPVHFSGQMCDMPAIGALARSYGFRVIEDASHAIGATWEGDRAGDCRHSDVTVFSFHPVKIVTTAEGGIAVTRDPELAKRMRTLRSHGISRDLTDLEYPSQGAWYYEQIALGFNYRLTDLQAVLGISQLDRLDEFLARRRQLARKYDELLGGLPLILPKQDSRSDSAWHLYVIQLLPKDGNTDGHRHAVFKSMHASGVAVNVHYIPLHLQPYYRKLGFKPGDYPNAERYYERALSIPMFYGLSDDDQRRVVDALRVAIKTNE